jgi:hypothetical protein
MVARQWNSCKYRSLLLYKIGYAHLASSLETKKMEKWIILYESKRDIKITK